MARSKENVRENKAMQSILRGENPEKRIMVGYDTNKKPSGDQIDRLSDIMKEARMPWFCPSCDKVMKKRLDNQSWILPRLDIKFLNNLSECLIGNLDFLSFSKFRKDLKNTKCTIFSAYWKKDKEMYTFHVNANRYLHHMIRYIVGSMIGVYQNRMSRKNFLLLIKKPRKNAFIFKAPPQGLILNKVNYD